MPNPEGRPWNLLVLLGGSKELAGALLEAGVARRVATRVPAERVAEAAVVLGPRGATLERVAACLRPGGILYLERRTRRAEEIRRELGGLGLRDVRCYGSHPELAGREAFVPLDAPAVAEWYFENVISRSPEPSSKMEVAATAIWGGGSAAPSVLGLPSLRRRWSSPNFATLVLTGGSGGDVFRRVVLLPFADGASEPALVAKLWRTPDRNEQSEREQTILREIRALGPSDTSPGVPEPLGVYRWGSLDVAVEGFCPGRPFGRISSAGAPPARRIGDLARTLAGLAEFSSRVVASRETWGAGEARARMHRLLARYESEFAPTAPERRVLERARERSDALASASMPIVWSHPDLGPANVLVTNGGVRILDWATAAPNLPLLDLLYFAFVAAGGIAGASDEGGRLALLRRLFLEPAGEDPLAEAVRDGVSRALRALALDPGFLPILLLALWVGRSLGRLDRARAVARGEVGVNPKQGNPYPAYVRALAERGEDLFIRFPPSGSDAGASPATPRAARF